MIGSWWRQLDAFYTHVGLLAFYIGFHACPVVPCLSPDAARWNLPMPDSSKDLARGLIGQMTA